MYIQTVLLIGDQLILNIADSQYGRFGQKINSNFLPTIRQIYLLSSSRSTLYHIYNNYITIILKYLLE